MVHKILLYKCIYRSESYFTTLTGICHYYFFNDNIQKTTTFFFLWLGILTVLLVLLAI